MDRNYIVSNNKIKKVIDVFTFEALRSYNLNNKVKILLKGGKLYNILINENNTFDVDVLYNSVEYNIEEVREYFSIHFEKHKKNYHLIKNIIIKNKIIDVNNKKIVKFSMLLYNNLIPFFEITFGECVDKYWMYSYGIYCILPSYLITNLMDMANQNIFHKRFYCREKLNKLINNDYLSFNYQMDKEQLLSEYDFLEKIPKDYTILIKSKDELLSQGLTKEEIKKIIDNIKKFGNLNKYAFINQQYKVELNYKIKEYKPYLDIFYDAHENNREFYVSKLKDKFINYTKNDELCKFNDLTIHNLLSAKVLNVKYRNIDFKQKYDIGKDYILNKKILSPIYFFSIINNFKKIIENKKFFIKTNFQKSIDNNKVITIPKYCLGLKPTLFVIIPNINNNKYNICNKNNTEYFISNVKCLKKREIYYKVKIDKLVLLEKLKLVILQEIIE